MNLFVAAVAAVLSLTNEYVTVDFDAQGRFSSVRECVSGRELLRKPIAAVRVSTDTRRNLEPVGFSTVDGKRLTWRFADGGEAAFSVRPFAGGWTFTSEALTVPGATSVAFLRLDPVPEKWIGTLANLFSDEQSGVCVRGYECHAMMFAYRPSGLSVEVKASDGPLTGWHAGLAAGPRAALVPMLKAMTFDAGVPHSAGGGIWGLESEATRGSYLFVIPNTDTVDDWIAVARKGGFRTMHFGSSWSGRLGDYPPNPYLWPQGLEEFKAAVAKVRAAGLKTGMHTLTGCISPKTPWVTPKASPHLQTHHSYTLAEPLRRGDAELRVNERPADDHDIVFTYMGNGNVFRLGTELIQYTGVRREKPYAFTGLKRGAFATTVGGEYPAGTRADYLRQRYLNFYPDPDSPLADEVADAIAKTFNACGFDMVYNDGAEGMGSVRARYVMRRKIIERLVDGGRHAVQNEDSCGCGAGCWWFHSRIGAWDHALWGAKPFTDLHLSRILPKCRDANLMAPQLGWWSARTADKNARGLRPDEMEYFAGKVAGHDASMSVQNIDVLWNPLTYQADEMLTLLGWWEHARMAGAFAPETAAKLREPGREFRLRQDDEGEWRLWDAVVTTHRAGSPETSAWTVDVGDAESLELRVEALYSGKTDAPTGADLLEKAKPERLKVTAADGVTAAVSAGADASHGASVRLTAENANATSRGAWTVARLQEPAPYLQTGTSFVAWVKGDASGALLNLQLGNPREFGECFDEHYVRLDFAGWRKVEFHCRERDGADFSKYVWPYGNGDPYAVYRYALKPAHVSTVALALNEVPAKGRTSVEVASFRPIELKRNRLKDVRVTAGGRTLTLPFELDSGDYAMLSGGVWTRFSELGEPIEQAPAPTGLDGLSGPVPLSIAAKGEEGLVPRAEVTLFALGKDQPAFRTDDDVWKTRFDYEAMMPFVFAPARGFTATPKLCVRPDEQARVTLELGGAVKNPRFTWRTFFGLRKHEVRFPVTLAKDERLVCEDGLNWRKIGKDRKTAEEGRLDEAIPLFEGTTDWTFEADDPDAADVRIDVVKRYVRPTEANAERRIMSFNVRHCEGMDKKLDLARTAAAIRKENPDFVGLQELDTAASRSQFIDEPTELARLTGLHVTFAKAIPHEKGDYGNALLSREKPLSVTRVPLPGGEPRVLLLCEFADCVVGTTHLAVDSEKARTESVALIREAVGRFSGKKPVFLTGDWNSLPDSSVLKGLGEFLTVLSETKGQTYHGSVVNGPDKRPLDMSRFCIDYIAVDSAHADDVEVAEARVVNDRNTSDHAPIVVRLAK